MDREELIKRAEAFIENYVAQELKSIGLRSFITGHPGDRLKLILS